jgi:CheY-like chemotaxis protein
MDLAILIPLAGSAIAGVTSVVVALIQHARRRSVPPPPATAPRLTQPSLPEIEGTVRALVVFHERSYAQVVRGVVANHGYTVDVAHSADEALRQFDRHPYALVLLDLALPDMPGEELARRLRPRILILSDVADERFDAARSAGIADLVLAKPDRLEDLEAVIAALRLWKGGQSR